MLLSFAHSGFFDAVLGPSVGVNRVSLHIVDTESVTDQVLGFVYDASNNCLRRLTLRQEAGTDSVPLVHNLPTNPIVRFFPLSDTLSNCVEHAIVVFPVAPTPSIPSIGIIGTCVTSQGVGGFAMHNVCIRPSSSFANGAPAAPVVASTVAAAPVAASPVAPVAPVAAVSSPAVVAPAAAASAVVAPAAAASKGKDKKPVGIVKKLLTLGGLKKRRLSPVFAGDDANGVSANQINSEFALMKFCDVVAPGVFSVTRAAASGAASGRSVVHISRKKSSPSGERTVVVKSFSEVLDLLKSYYVTYTSLDFYAEMKSNCMKYLGAQDVTWSKTTHTSPSGSVSSMRDEAEALMDASDDDDD